MDTWQMNVVNSDHQPDERILHLKCRCTCLSLKCLLWRMKASVLSCVVKTLNVSTCEYIYIFILLSKDVFFLLFSESNFLTWNLDSILSQPPLGPKSYNYSYFSVLTVFFFGSLGSIPSTFKQKQVPKFQILYSTLLIYLATIQSAFLLSQPNSAKVSFIPVDIIFFHTYSCLNLIM